MTTLFPATIDVFANPTAGDYLDAEAVPHSAQHANANDAIKALQQKVGIDSSDDPNSLDYMVAKKVDQEPGKGLSSNDYSDAEKTKLGGIAEGANAYTHPDHHAPSIIEQDADHQFVSDLEKEFWGQKLSPDDVPDWAKAPSKPSYTADEVGAQPPIGTVSGLVKGAGENALTEAVPGLDYQEPLVSGENIKTLNGESLIGSGDLKITATGAGVDVIDYDNRATLRELTPDADALILVESLGLFRFFTSSFELDDDETCFSAASGQWLLEAADPEYTLDILDDLSSYIKEEMEDLSVAIEQKIEKSKLLRGSFSMSLTSLAAIASSAFSATIAGAAVGDAVIVNPGNAFGTSATDQGRLSYIAYVSAPDTVTVSIRNASAASAAMTASTWGVLVVKTVS